MAFVGGGAAMNCLPRRSAFFGSSDMGRDRKGGVCGRRERTRRLRFVVTCKYHIRYDQTKPDMNAPPVSWVTIEDEVRFVIRLLRRGEVAYAKKRFLEDLRDVELPAHTYGRLIGAFGKFMSSEVAERVYAVALWRLNEDKEHTLGLSLLKVFAKRGEFDKMERFFEKFESPTVPMRTALVKAFGLSEDFQRAEAYAIDDIDCINTLLHVYASKQKFEAMTTVLKRIDTSSVLRRNIETYNILLCADKSDLERAQKLFEELRQLGLRPDVVTYTSLMAMYAKKDDLQGMGRAYEQMQSDGIRPTVTTFNVVIYSLTRCGRVKQAEQALEQMTQMKVFPNTATYNMIMKLHNDIGEVQMSRDLFEAMIFGRRLVPSVYSYNTMIAGYAKEGKLFATERLFRRMVETGVEPNRVTYVTMMDAHARKLKPLGARGYLRLMSAKGIEPDERALGVMAVAWARTGKVGGAMATLREMKRRKMPPSVHGFTAVMKAHICRKDIGAAQIVLEQMLSEGLTPSVVTYNVLLDGYAKKGMREEGEALVRSMQAEPNVVTYTTLMNLYASLGDVNSVENTFQELQDAGIRPNVTTFGVLADCYRKAGPVEKCSSIVMHMKQFGLEANAHIYGTIIAMYVSQSDLPAAVKTHRTMLENRVRPTRVTYITLIHALLKAHFFKASNALFEEARGFHIDVPPHLYHRTDRRARRSSDQRVNRKQRHV